MSFSLLLHASLGTNVLLINTAAPMLGPLETGVWLEELATPYYAFKDAHFGVVMASPKGGPSPIDKGSLSGDFFTSSSKEFLHDASAMNLFGHQKTLEEVEPTVTDEFDAVYLTGGHGCAADFVDNAKLTSIIERMYAAGKVVAADCHGPIGLVGAKKPDGTPLVAGKKVTGFTDSEEHAVHGTEIVPFLIETKFKQLGGNFVAGADWSSNVAVDGKLVTGQNPQSSEEAARAVIKLLTAKDEV